MNTRNRFTARFGPQPDLLGFAAGATPSADEWLAAFTQNFMGNPDAEHGARVLMSGLRFYTPAFMAEIAALPPVETRQPHIAGNIPRAVYTATGAILAGAYQTLISRNAGSAAIQAAFTQATPALTDYYTHTVQTSSVRRPITAWLRTPAARSD